MKILFLCRLFYPHIGGVEKHVMEVSKILIKKRHEVTVFTEALKGTKSFEEVNGIQVYRILAGKEDKFKKIRIWKEMSRLQSIIKDADVVHCHDVFFWYLPFRLLYPNKPVFTTFHGYESYPISQKAIKVRKFTERLSWGNICIGDFIPKWYGTHATIVSYGGTDSKSLDSRFRENDEGRVKKDSAVFIGRLDEQTGALTYAEAVDLVKKKYPQFAFVFVGDGSDRQKIEKRFKVLGFQKDPEKYFEKYHFAFVSRYLSILEAFAAKKLVFAGYDNPVKEDYLKLAPFAKWIVIEKTPEKLAERVAYFIKHPEEEKKMIEKGYEWVRRQSWDEMVTRYLTLWKLKQ